jgi:hypothetical protein
VLYTVAVLLTRVGQNLSGRNSHPDSYRSEV